MAEKHLTQEEIREKIWEQNRAKNFAASSKGRSAGQGLDTGSRRKETLYCNPCLMDS